MGLRKRYNDGFEAVKNISFGVNENCVFGLLGPNGAGKTTIFNILSGMIPKTEGNIKFNQK